MLMWEQRGEWGAAEMCMEGHCRWMTGPSRHRRRGSPPRPPARRCVRLSGRVYAYVYMYEHAGVCVCVYVCVCVCEVVSACVRVGECMRLRLRHHLTLVIVNARGAAH
jgi:hypothetical protein